MRSFMWALPLSIVLLGSASNASAKGLPPLASEQDPPRFIDETDLDLVLLNRPPDGYWFRIRTSIQGPLSPSDAVRIEFVQNGKVLAQERCPLDVGRSGADVRCTYEGKPIKAVGKVTANLILIDDQAEKDYLLRQFHVTVAVFPWMKEKHYQILHDDMLGTAFAWHRTAESSNEGDHQVVLYFWVAGLKSGDHQLRCTVNGTKVPDFEVWFASDGGYVEVDYLVNGQDRRYRWAPRAMTISRLLWGTHKALEERRLVGKGAGDARLLHEMAGDWACNLRHEGQVVRQFAFKVNDSGMIEPSAAQSAPGFPRLFENVVHVDMRLPAKNSYDQRVVPGAIKSSMRYGMPWPKHPMLDAFRNSLPPPSGLPDPGKR